EPRHLAGAPLLVRRGGREGSYRPLPPPRPPSAGDLPGDHIHAVWAVLKLHRGVRPEVVVPLRMGRGTALRRDGRVPAVMLDPHHRSLAYLAAADPAVGDDHHGQAGVTQRRALRPARAFVEFHLIPDPGPRARLVVILNWHAASQAPGRHTVAMGPGVTAPLSGRGGGRRQRESMGSARSAAQRAIRGAPMADGGKTGP